MTAAVIPIEQARPTCEVCGDRTYTDGYRRLCRTCDAAEIARIRAEYDQRRAEYVAEKTDRGLEGVPRWPHARIGSESWSRIYPTLRAWAETWLPSAGSAILLGPSGAGKTTSVVAMLHRHAAEVRAAAQQCSIGRCDELSVYSRIVWTTARQIVSARRQAPLGEGEPPELAAWRQASILVIDEIGFESRDPDPDLFGMVDDRYAARRPTIVTSGLTRDQLIARYGAAMLRRLGEAGIGQIIDCHATAKGRKNG